jgi:CHAT domain
LVLASAAWILGRPRQQETESYQAWRNRVGECAYRSTAAREDAYCDADLSKQMATIFNAATDAGLEVTPLHPSTLEYALLKSELPQHLRRVSPLPSVAEIRRTAVDIVARWVSEAVEREVDLLFLTLSDKGVSAAHFSAGTATWSGTEFLPALNRPMLAAHTAPFSIGERAILPWVGPDDQSMDTKRIGEALPSVWFAFAIVDELLKQFTLGRRVAVSLSPDLIALPLTPVLAWQLGRQASGHVAELVPVPAQVEATVSSTDTFTAFALESMSPAEVIWQDFRMELRKAPDFTPKAVLDALASEVDVVHVATHGVFDPYDPLFSFIVTHAGPLLALDIARGSFRAPLLVLNSCASLQSGLAGGVAGYPMGRIAVANGVRVVLGNIFPIESEVAARFALAFQRLFGRGGLSLAGAYSEALSAFDSNSPEALGYSLLGASIEELFTDRPIGTPAQDSSHAG